MVSQVSGFGAPMVLSFEFWGFGRGSVGSGFLMDVFGFVFRVYLQFRGKRCSAHSSNCDFGRTLAANA